MCSWPASSPDLTPPDFFLCGHLKSQVCQNNPRSLEDLKDAVKTAMRRLSLSMCRAAAEAVLRRASVSGTKWGTH